MPRSDKNAGFPSAPRTKEAMGMMLPAVADAMMRDTVIDNMLFQRYSHEEVYDSGIVLIKISQ